MLLRIFHQGQSVWTNITIDEGLFFSDKSIAFLKNILKQKDGERLERIETQNILTK